MVTMARIGSVPSITASMSRSSRTISSSRSKSDFSNSRRCRICTPCCGRMRSMADRPTQKTPELLRALLEAEVDFVVVGGVAAIAHGSATFTLDMDVVAPLSVENCERILCALGPLSPRFYQTPGSPRVMRTAQVRVPSARRARKVSGEGS